MKLSFYEQGEGKAILLIHGFPMNASIWNKFSPPLSSAFKVISVDLPGFGSSPLLPGQFSLEDVADVVIQNLQEKKISEIIPIGHSLGGYVVLAMVSKRPDLFPGFGLLHSTALADSQEKKESRNKVIEFIKNNGARAFTSNFIDPLFSNSEHPDVPFVREMNMKTDEQTLIAYLKAMRDREDRTELYETFEKPILVIAGANDPGITVSSIQEQTKLLPNVLLKILNDQAHMGLVEDVETTSSIVYEFVSDCYN
jgi:pimeloyl-ACP methyl ester carboxylesterase